MSSRADGRPGGALQLLALGLNGIVGVGIFFVPASVAATAPGLGAVAVFALTGLEPSAADSYTLSNVAISYATEDRAWLARAFVENVTDEEYLVQTFDLSGPGNSGMTEQYYGRPQWWGVSLQYNFGG